MQWELFHKNLFRKISRAILDICKLLMKIFSQPDDYLSVKLTNVPADNPSNDVILINQTIR